MLTQGKEAKGVFYIQRSETLVAQLGKSAATDQVKATRLKMIELLTTLKDDEALMRELEQYNRDYPHDTTMLKELAYRYSAQGREDDAAPLFQRIYQMNPNDPDAISFLLDEKVRDGEGEEALDWLDVHRGSFTPEDYRVRAISLAYDADPTRLKALCLEPLPPEHEARVLCLIHQGRIKEAKRVLKPEESVRDRVTIAYLLLEEGDDEGARSHIEILEKRGGLTPQERRGLKRFLAEVERNHRRERAFVLSGEATFFDSSADYDFRSERVELARKVTGPWHFGVELYEQKYQSRGKYNVGPVLYYRQPDYFLRYHYGITQNSHLLSYRRQLTPALSGALHAGRGTPFTDLFTVSFRTDVRQRPLTAELDYFKGRHSAALTFENNLYTFDSGHDSVGRNQTLASYRYTHKNRIFQEVGLVDIRYDAEEIADVTFADLTYGYYKLGYHYKKAPWEVIPAASAGQDFNANEGFGSIVGYELTLVRDTGPDRRIQLTLEHRNIGQQNIKQDTNVAYLSFIHWID